MKYKIGLSLILAFVLIGCETGSPKQVQRPDLNTNGNTSQISNSYQSAQEYMPQIKDQLQNDLLDAVRSQDGRYLFVLKKNSSGQQELQLWDNENKKYLYSLARSSMDKHIEGIRAMSNNRVMFLEVQDGMNSRSGRVVVIDYKQKRVLGTYALQDLPQNYYTNINVDSHNQNIVNVGDVSIDFSNESRPVAHSRPTQLNVVNSNGTTMDRDIENYFGDDLVMAVPTLQRQGLFVVKQHPHQTQSLELYGMIGGIDYEYTLWEVGDGERFARIIPQSNGRVVFIITSDIAPAGYARIVTYNYANKYKISEKSVQNLYEPATYVVGQYANTSSYNDSYSSSSEYQDSDYSTGSAWANSDTSYNYIYDDNYNNSDYSTGSASANSDWAVLKQGTWRGRGHQTWKRESFYEIELSIADNEYYFSYVGDDYSCYGSLVLQEKTANSFTFREYVYDGRCVENYFILKKITDDHYSYESYLLDGTPTVTGDVSYSSSSF